MYYQKRYNDSQQYQLMCDFGEGPTVLCVKYSLDDAIKTKHTYIEKDGIYPVIVRVREEAKDFGP